LFKELEQLHDIGYSQEDEAKMGVKQILVVETTKMNRLLLAAASTAGHPSRSPKRRQALEMLHGAGL